MNSDPVGAIESRKDYAWYIPNIDKKITPDARKLLETYSRIPPDEVRQHVYDIRDKAWAIRPYPCTGMGSFLDPMIAKSPAYHTIISRLQSGASLLDVGCFIGQDLRRLVFDGAPAANLYAVDIVSHWEVGYELFRDRDRFSASFMETDILNPNEELRALLEKIDVLNVTHVLHQWEWEQQVEAAKQLSKFSRPGTLVVGYQAASTGGPKKETRGERGAEYTGRLQNVESWDEMWDAVGKGTGTEWKSEAKLKTWAECGYDPEETAYLGEDARLIEFVVTRVR